MNFLTPLQNTALNPISPKNKREKLINNQTKDLLNLLYQCPADEQIIGKTHKQNTDFGFKTRKKSQQQSYCPCCKIQYKQKELHFRQTHTTPTLTQIQSMKKREYINPLSSQILSYFTFIKILVIYLILRCLIVDIWLIIGRYFTNVLQIPRLMMYKQFLNQDLIESSMPFLMIELQNALEYYHIFVFLFLFFIIASIQYFKRSSQYQFQIYQAAEANCHSENRYSLLVQNIPMRPIIEGLTQKKFDQISYEKRLKQYFKSYIINNLFKKVKQQFLSLSIDDDNELNQFEQILFKQLNQKQKNNFPALEEEIVQTVNVCYDTSPLMRIQSQKHQLISQYHRLKKQNPNQQSNHILQLLKSVNETHLKMVQKFTQNHKYQQRLPFFQGSAFIIFDYQIYRDFILAEYVSNPSKFQINSNQLIISPGDQPSTVEWYSFRYARETKLRSRIYTFLILILVLLFTFIALSYCEIYRIIPILESQLNLPKKYQHRIKMLMISIITASINYLMSQILQHLAKSEKRRNQEEIIISLLTKNVINQFINSALIYYLITFITPENIRFETNDLAAKVESLIIVSGTLKLVNNFITLSYAKKKLQHYFFSKNKFQIQVNSLLERPQFSLVNKYSYYIVQLLTVSFYATLSPVVAPALTIIFVVQYFIDKLILFNKSSTPPKISFKVTDWALYLAQWSLLAHIVGWIIFCSADEWTPLTKVVSYLTLILVVIYLVWRYRRQQRSLYHIAHMFKSSISHQQCKNELYQTFEQFNPWTYLTRNQQSSSKPQYYQINSSTPAQMQIKISFTEQQQLI